MEHILITGGTGTLGNALIDAMYGNDKIIHILSRDENKQKVLKRQYPQVMCHVGDICDREDLHRISQWNFTDVFHCAASKHIEICENHVSKCVKTNFEGTKNVYHVLGRFCKRFVFFTTDKAVGPINAYGYSKALAEKYLHETNPDVSNIWIFRWGNIIGSNGSVIPLFIEAVRDESPVFITHPDMSRFWLTIESAVKFTLETINTKNTGVYFPGLIKAAYLLEVIESIGRLYAKIPLVRDIGLRPGEKIHEAMTLNSHGLGLTSDNCERFTIEELMMLIEPIKRKMES